MGEDLIAKACHREISAGRRRGRYVFLAVISGIVAGAIARIRVKAVQAGSPILAGSFFALVAIAEGRANLPIGGIVARGVEAEIVGIDRARHVEADLDPAIWREGKIPGDLIARDDPSVGHRGDFCLAVGLQDELVEPAEKMGERGDVVADGGDPAVDLKAEEGHVDLVAFSGGRELAVIARKAVGALAGIPVDLIGAVCPILAGVGVTLVNVRVAIFPGVAWHAGAVIRAIPVGAGGTILARV